MLFLAWVALRKKNIFKDLVSFFFTLTFDRYVILSGQGQLYILKWYDVSTIYGLKVVSVLTI